MGTQNNDGAFVSGVTPTVFGAEIRQGGNGGSGNEARIEQISDGNRAFTNQQGTSLSANVLQDGDGGSNVSRIDQSGTGGSVLLNANVVQSGLGNTSDIDQDGTSQQADVTQLGDNNDSFIIQNGTGHFAEVTQNSSDNFSTITQNGTGMSAIVTQGAPSAPN